ncbi:hypothetical protein EDB87DRAFT_853498 [Lactarius vividus]|nr:hypothetical protein EDB87DRAFT_853498 [Lactarius vividus]
MGLETMSLLILLPFFGETRPEGSKLTIGLPRRKYWVQVNPRIADQLPLPEQDLRLPPTKIEMAKVSELALVDRKSPCVRECLYVMSVRGVGPGRRENIIDL